MSEHQARMMAALYSGAIGSKIGSLSRVSTGFSQAPGGKTALISYLTTGKTVVTAPVVDQTIDYVIVGAGATGAYLAKRLSLQFPDAKILILEKESDVGGRLRSINHATSTDELAQVELGGMRYFPSIHTITDNVVKLLDLSAVEVPYVQDNGVFYARASSFKNDQLAGTDLVDGTDKVYFIDGAEKQPGVPIDARITDNITRLLTTGNLNFANRKELFGSESSTLDFRGAVMNGYNTISNEYWTRFCEVSGYASLFNTNMSFLVGANELLSLDDKDKTQYFIKQGYQEIPGKLVTDFAKPSIQQVVAKNMAAKNNILHGVSLSKFELVSNNKVKLYITDNDNNKFQFETKNLYICTPKESILNINGFSGKFIDQMHNNLTQVPLFKMFLHYDSKWWGDLDISNGRSTTDLNLNQVWFYSENLIMIYAVGDDANYWANRIPVANQPSFTSDSLPVVEEITDELNKMFPLESGTVPLPGQIAWSYWLNGASVWAPFNLHTFDKTQKISTIRQELMYPLTENDHRVCYLNNDISLNQGWVEGCFEIVDEFLQEKFNMGSVPDPLVSGDWASMSLG